MGLFQPFLEKKPDDRVRVSNVASLLCALLNILKNKNPVERLFLILGSGGNEFLPACSAARSAAVGWEAARPCVSREAKPAKIDSLIEKDFCARLLKNVSIFAGFAGRRQAASRWADSAPVRAQNVAQKRFEWRSVTATKIYFWIFEGARKILSSFF